MILISISSDRSYFPVLKNSINVATKVEPRDLKRNSTNLEISKFQKPKSKSSGVI